MPILHIVLFEFKPATTHDQVVHVCKRMVGLAQQCVHPTSQKPYMRSLGGGRDNSPEGNQVVCSVDIIFTSETANIDQGGFSHGFICEFDNEEDRNYYLDKDPAHLAFVKSLDGIIQNVRVVDFEPGKF